MTQPSDVIKFWFVEHGPEQWFSGGEEFDVACAARFSSTHEQASRGELYHWRDSLVGRRAEIILLDQLSRQLNRGSPKAFAQDLMALTLAQYIVGEGLDKGLTPHEKMFVYMPYMHSESLVIQEIGMALFSQPDTQSWLDFQKGHRDVIARFGRFPKRNKALGRVPTPEEIDYLKEIGDRVF
ncbi:DUF924 domain-containing protein [Devosia rhodophyticola]|uniref:DUF924 domain-containing protein n=1 Tax=Devosia rhodophyticola TaxID=3026423 RepID=A0ABY7YZC3_9HYPH|nr:DUF924 family protein [Devosia rhodophyticola]WDR06738.1 DUF924 domain-containing protein [Devosia rhodophyticola]